MFTFVIIIVIIWIIVASSKAKRKPDKRDEKKIEADIIALPDFCLVAKPMTDFNKWMNLSFKGTRELNKFEYKNKILTITLKDGSSLSAPLSAMKTAFQDVKGEPFTVVVEANGKTIAFYEMVGIFDKSQWELIYRVMCLSGETYGREVFTDAYKYTKTASNVVSIVRFLNKL